MFVYLVYKEIVKKKVKKILLKKYKKKNVKSLTLLLENTALKNKYMLGVPIDGNKSVRWHVS